MIRHRVNGIESCRSNSKSTVTVASNTRHTRDDLESSTWDRYESLVSLELSQSGLKATHMRGSSANATHWGRGRWETTASARQTTRDVFVVSKDLRDQFLIIEPDFLVRALHELISALKSVKVSSIFSGECLCTFNTKNDTFLVLRSLL